MDANGMTERGLGPGESRENKAGECAGADRAPARRSRPHPASSGSYTFAPPRSADAAPAHWASQRAGKLEGFVTLRLTQLLPCWRSPSRRRAATVSAEACPHPGRGRRAAHGGAASAPAPARGPTVPPAHLTPHPPQPPGDCPGDPGASPSWPPGALSSVLTPPGAPPGASVGRGASPPPLRRPSQDPARTADTFGQFQGRKSVPAADKDSFLTETWFSRVARSSRAKKL